MLSRLEKLPIVVLFASTQALLISNNIYNMNNQQRDRLFQMASLYGKSGIGSKSNFYQKYLGPQNKDTIIWFEKKQSKDINLSNFEITW